MSEAEFKNCLLAFLPDEAIAPLLPSLERVDCPMHFSLSRSGQPSAFTYFPETCVASIVADGAEVGLIGHEGMTNSALAFEVETTPFSIVVQVAGESYRTETARLVEAIADSAQLERVIARYAYALSVQTSYTALSNARDAITLRLARWILMCHDRTEGDTIGLTHDYLGVMLGVRRSSVTTALHVLEGEHLIYSERSMVRVRNRQGLEVFAGPSYGQPEAEYLRLFPLAAQNIRSERTKRFAQC